MQRSPRTQFVYQVLRNRHKLGLSFVLVFTFTLVVLGTVGLTPEAPEAVKLSEKEDPSVVQTVRASTPEPVSKSATSRDTRPLRVVIESVGIDVHIETPASKDVAVLDNALLRGAVHYPGSGTLADDSNMFIFGHSSYLPAVNNQNFKAFNGLQKVKEGDLIRVESNDTVNLYQVLSLELVSSDEALIELSSRTRMLTLSTCNSFGDPSDRYVVKADFVRSFELTRPVSYLDKQ